ncbi:hypothetical protein JTB14_000506 [Gonioctena quinquepunctata]|nr:hypothetical protein JTB14_000506 [Gonioctena quinquepunctata]
MWWNEDPELNNLRDESEVGISNLNSDEEEEQFRRSDRKNEGASKELIRKDRKMRIAAMDEEMNAMYKNKTWNLSIPPENKNIVDC